MRLEIGTYRVGQSAADATMNSTNSATTTTATSATTTSLRFTSSGSHKNGT